MKILLLGHKYLEEYEQDKLIKLLKEVIDKNLDNLLSKGLINENLTFEIKYNSCDFNYSDMEKLSREYITPHIARVTSRGCYKSDKRIIFYAKSMIRSILRSQEYAMVIAFNRQDNRRNIENKEIIELARKKNIEVYIHYLD